MDTSALDSILNVLQATAAKASGRAQPVAAEAAGADFSSVLKGTLDRVNNSQLQADGLARAFEAGAPEVSLSDTMIAMQKANIALQTTVQVRNRLVTAYNDMMNMQV